MILDESRGAALVLGIGQQVTAHGRAIPGAQPIVQTLVVGVVEPLLLEGPLEIPVGLGHEDELGPPLTHARDGRRPEGIVHRRAAVGRP